MYLLHNGFNQYGDGIDVDVVTSIWVLQKAQRLICAQPGAIGAVLHHRLTDAHQAPDARLQPYFLYGQMEGITGPIRLLAMVGSPARSLLRTIDF